jgi:outer membrane protein OmpA-like peptidoglycan-associated protein
LAFRRGKRLRRRTKEFERMRTMPPKRLLIAVALGAISSAVGCGFVPKTQFNACESQARILGEQSKAQLAEIANLKTHAKKLEDDLLAAQRQIASLERGSDADRKRISNFQVEREKVQEQVQGLVRGATLTGIVPVRDDEIERLLKKYPLLRFDSATGAYKLDAELAFDGTNTRISPQSEKLLQEFASLFAEPDARNLRVLVVGRASGGGETTDAERLGTDRALAVAGYLRKVGLKSEQIGVSGLAGGGTSKVATPATNPSAADAGKPRRVEIFVMGKKTPIVGWDEAAAGRF